jgi:hypothetical protein
MENHEGMMQSMLAALKAPIQFVRRSRHYAFLNAVAHSLGQTGSIRDHGAARSIRVQISGRILDIGIQGPEHWVRIDLRWPGFPSEVVIAHHPMHSYWRNAALSEGVAYAPTGDSLFDTEYLVLGEPEVAQPLAAGLGDDLRRVLLLHRSLHLEITPMEMFAIEGPLIKRLHLHASPMGPQLTKTTVLGTVSQCIELVDTIESMIIPRSQPNHSMQPTVPLRGPAADIDR